jgi:hypothetical protein
MRRAKTVAGAGLTLAGALLSGCDTLQGNIALGAVVTTAYLAQAPTTEVTQIYYLGVFDPQDQVPPAVYRVRVKGQASWLSTTNFASGWVRAELVDSLGTTLSAPAQPGDAATIKKTEELQAKLRTGRRLVMFGPEGFREAPAEHRLVIVTGSSPEKYFEALDQVLGEVSGAIEGQRGSALNRQLLDALTALNGERTRLADLQRDLDSDAALLK